MAIWRMKYDVCHWQVYLLQKMYLLKANITYKYYTIKKVTKRQHFNTIFSMSASKNMFTSVARVPISPTIASAKMKYLILSPYFTFSWCTYIFTNRPLNLHQSLTSFLILRMPYDWHCIWTCLTSSAPDIFSTMHDSNLQ